MSLLHCPGTRERPGGSSAPTAKEREHPWERASHWRQGCPGEGCGAGAVPCSLQIRLWPPKEEQGGEGLKASPAFRGTGTRVAAPHGPERSFFWECSYLFLSLLNSNVQRGLWQSHGPFHEGSEPYQASQETQLHSAQACAGEAPEAPGINISPEHIP